VSAAKLAALTLCAALLPLAACDGVARPVAEVPGGGTGASGCTTCHGDASRPEATALLQAAPPAPADAAGAHAAHLHAGAAGGAVACAECHVVPTDTAHVNGEREVAFGPAWSRDGVTPARSAGTCTTYCHGASLGGGPAASPAWTSAGPLGCDDCHGSPPPSHAPTATQCASCHPGTVDVNGAILAANGLHLNGVVDSGRAHAPGWSAPDAHGRAANGDLATCRACHGAALDGGTSGVSCDSCHGGAAWRTDCTFCHGTPGRAGGYASAPPAGTQGETATTDRAVGAHEAHLAGGGAGPAVACAECHAVPADLAHVNGTAAVAFGAAARRGGAAPAWNTGPLTCSSTYCHGATLGAGGSNTAPTWTGGAAQASCGSCHGAPPPAPHSASTACGSCHAGYTQTTVEAATHLDGVLQATGGGHPAGFGAKEQHGYQANRDGLAACKSCHGADLAGGTSGTSCNSCHGGTAWQTSCTFCHGTPGALASPPVDTQGLSARSQVTVGAHAKHLSLALMTASSVTCTTCHPARGDVVTDAAHMDGGNAEVTFTGVAAQGSASTFTRTSDTAATCATYCHGRFTGGATTASPSWVSTTAMTCASCHGATGNTLTRNHTRSNHRIACSVCHGDGYTATVAGGDNTGTGVDAATHVDGGKTIVIRASGTGIRSWNASTRTCTASCHGSKTW
jgi:predicted CxxxxCH...CXXCH cytochrome family protein